jgi:hypothetical protein
VSGARRPERPDGAELLAIARQVFVGELAPLLPAEKRYAAALVASAMAMAEREGRAGDWTLVSLTRLRRIYAAPQDEWAELSARLARDIRAGVFDRPGERREAVRAHLTLSAEEALAISNPKALATS